MAGEEAGFAARHVRIDVEVRCDEWANVVLCCNQESMTTNCETGASGDYAPRHAPRPCWLDSSERTDYDLNDVPAGTAASGRLLCDIANGALPIAGELTPNLRNDAHDCSLTIALASWMPTLMAGPDYCVRLPHRRHHVRRRRRQRGQPGCVRRHRPETGRHVGHRHLRSPQPHPLAGRQRRSQPATQRRVSARPASRLRARSVGTHGDGGLNRNAVTEHDTSGVRRYRALDMGRSRCRRAGFQRGRSPARRPPKWVQVCVAVRRIS
jgi:hypothetical protein